MRAHVAAWLVTAALSSCSFSQNDGPPLEQVWASGRVVSINELAIAQNGATDDAHFYTLRQRLGEGRAFVAFSRETGRQMWERSVRGTCRVPVVTRDRIYCPADRVYAFEAQTGRALWSAEAPTALSLTQGTADAERVYVGTVGPTPGPIPGAAYAFDAQTGALVWEKTLGTDEWPRINVRSLTLSPEGDLLVAFEAEYVTFSVFSAAVILALDPATGEERWRYVDGDRTQNREVGGLTFFEDLMLYSDPSGQQAVAVDRATRQVAWRAAYTPSSFSTFRPPLVEDGVAYFTDTQGGVFAVDARTGQQRWKLARPYGVLGHEVCGDVLLAYDQIGDVYDRTDGRYLGRLLDDGDTIGQVATAGDVLYVSAASGVYAFDCNP